MKCIYQISSIDSNIDEFYIGSTVEFKDRIGEHKSRYNCGSKIKLYEFIRANGGLSNWDIIPIEIIDFPISTEELRQYEQGYLDKYKPQLNSLRAYRTEEQRKDQEKEHNKEYYENNKAYALEQSKEYYEKNKEQVSIKGKQKGNCPHCSKEMRKDSIKRHIRMIHPTLV
tara:strand:+ start:264 stop:773 length:510 start_codon:yes stop_codon:yes gene_type:complete